MPSRSKRRQKTSDWQRLDRGEIKIMQMIEGWRPAKGVFAVTWSQQNTVIEAVAEAHAEFARSRIDRLRRQLHSLESFQTEVHRIRVGVPEVAVEMWESVMDGLPLLYSPSADGEEPIFAGLTLPFAVDLSDLSKDYPAIARFVVKERTRERVDRVARAALIRNLKDWSRFEPFDVIQKLRRSVQQERLPDGGTAWTIEFGSPEEAVKAQGRRNFLDTAAIEGIEVDPAEIDSASGQPPAMTPAAKSLDRAERRGRRGNPKRHRDIATIALLRYGEKWPDHLQDVCTDIDAAKIAPRVTPNWKETWLATLDQPRGPEIVKKAIQASVKASKEA